MTDFTTVHDRLLKVKRENPGAAWPELLIRRVERRALILEVSRSEARK